MCFVTPQFTREINVFDGFLRFSSVWKQIDHVWLFIKPEKKNYKSQLVLHMLFLPVSFWRYFVQILKYALVAKIENYLKCAMLVEFWKYLAIQVFSRAPY